MPKEQESYLSMGNNRSQKTLRLVDVLLIEIVRSGMNIKEEPKLN